MNYDELQRDIRLLLEDLVADYVDYRCIDEATDSADLTAGAIITLLKERGIIA